MRPTSKPTPLPRSDAELDAWWEEVMNAPEPQTDEAIEEAYRNLAKLVHAIRKRPEAAKLFDALDLMAREAEARKTK